MTTALPPIATLLTQLSPFADLPESTRRGLEASAGLLRFRIGQPLVQMDRLASQILWIVEGQVRLVAYDPYSHEAYTLDRLEPGVALGWLGLLRGSPCEAAIASTETVCLTLESKAFLELLQHNPALLARYGEQAQPSEIADCLNHHFRRSAMRHPDPRSIIRQALGQTVLRVESQSPLTLPSDQRWLLSSALLKERGVGDELPSGQALTLQRDSWLPARLLGFPRDLLTDPTTLPVTPVEVLPPDDAASTTAWDADEIPYALITDSKGPSLAQLGLAEAERLRPDQKYPFFSGKGPLDGTLACVRMLANYYNMPFRRDVFQRILKEQLQRTGGLSIQICGALCELMGLDTQLAQLPFRSLSRIEPPVLIPFDDSFAVVYEASAGSVLLAIPGQGLRRHNLEELKESWGEEGQVLILRRLKSTPQKKFGLSWFLPIIRKYRWSLSNVLIASFFVQLFALAYPLLLQQIIDKVITQNNLGALHVLGLALVVFAIFQGILTTLRTYLFVDTTDRMDLTLGSEVIDRLLRLPLRYFEKRPVGELSSRLSELENVRNFLTGTALTGLLDIVFAVVYILVMFIYSPTLTWVALSTIPLYMLLVFGISPIYRGLIRKRAEENARTQSHLIEVLTGIQTVKAQNVELTSRWKWQDLYSKYVAEGFRTTVLGTAAGETGNFLNQLSSLLIIWVGAYLVLKQELTLGQLIAFRIIAGYVTQPLLRISNIWQGFQQTALSLERLSDIVDTPMEATEEDTKNIPMPAIEGAVRYEKVAFRFGQSGPLQLDNIDLEVAAGQFIGVVGQSGSGKSTMMKLLPRLYDPISGRILIDDYDISKVELYSLRRQIGIVPQESILFEGSIQENISLNNPDASSDAILDAARVACAHDFIMELPNGYNTYVGERGASLSGGQRQRIAIARTVLQNPRLLVLDEATSALDYDTERQLSLNLMEAFRGRTVFFITHRLNTIRSADRIVMLDKGAIVEQGTHEELMALRGRYYCLFRQQEALS
jgi:ATP-binding cassette, subfamily B, bacterial HlyB/CyaB